MESDQSLVVNGELLNLNALHIELSGIIPEEEHQCAKNGHPHTVEGLLRQIAGHQ